MSEMESKVRQMLRVSKWTQQELAKRIGVSQSTVNRWLRGSEPEGHHRDQINTLAEMLFETENETEDAIGVTFVRVKAHVQAGYWAETWELDEADQYNVPLPPDPEFASLKLHAAELRGQSMNKRWPEGTVLVFTDLIESGETILLGKRYIVERIRADGMREATVKKVWRDDDGQIWLVPESDDPRFQEPIAVNGDENETIRIVGRVRYAVSRE